MKRFIGLSLFLITIAGAQDPAAPPLPAPAVNPLISRIALGSCSSQDDPQPVLRHVVEWKPELFIYLGDNIYGDTRDMGLLAAKYQILGKRPEFRALRAVTPTVATWDDHDYGENDAGREYPMKEASKEIFLDFWQEPEGTPRRSRPGIYTHYVFADEEKKRRMQVIMLDTRTFRTPLSRNDGLSSWKNDYHPNPDPEKTFLGEAQWAWLKERLSEPADLRIIGTSIQFGHQHNGWESWTNFPSEIRKMVNLIKETRAGGVVFVSGDVHWAELSVLKAEGCYPIHDLTASGINKDWDVLEPNRNRVGEACMDHHFGHLEMDWSLDDPVLTFGVLDVDKRKRLERKVPLSALRFP